MKAAGILLKCQSFFFGYKTMGVYIDHPMCETTRKAKVLANTRDKKVIHQNGGRLALITQNQQGKEFRYAGRISLGSENFASLAKFR